MPDMSRVIAAAVALTLLLLLAGALTTRVDGWYRNLRKPAWTPPAWAFAPAWTVILAGACASGVLAWSRSATPGLHGRILLAFGANAVLPLVWSPIFFRLRRPDWALAEVVALWASIVAMILVVAPISVLAAWLLTPYLAWTTYAAALNLAIVRLNLGEGVVSRRDRIPPTLA